MNKKIFCAALAGIMMVSFAGCGKKENNSEDNGAATNVTVSANGSCPEQKNINNDLIGRVL